MLAAEDVPPAASHGVQVGWHLPGLPGDMFVP
jgi:hypothetical protein